MGNHFHLLLETPEANLVSGMKWFMGVFSQGWNRRRKRRGHVFQGRYKAVVVNGEGSGEYFRIVADYLHLNCLRSAQATLSGICSSANAVGLPFGLGVQSAQVGWGDRRGGSSRIGRGAAFRGMRRGSRRSGWRRGGSCRPSNWRRDAGVGRPTPAISRRGPRIGRGF